MHLQHNQYFLPILQLQVLVLGRYLIEAVKDFHTHLGRLLWKVHILKEFLQLHILRKDSKQLELQILDYQFLDLEQYHFFLF